MIPLRSIRFRRGHAIEASLAAWLLCGIQSPNVAAVRLDDNEEGAPKYDDVILELEQQERAAAADVERATDELRRAEAAGAAADQRADAFANKNRCNRKGAVSIPFHGSFLGGHVLEDVLQKQQELHHQDLLEVKMEIDMKPEAEAKTEKKSVPTTSTERHDEQVLKAAEAVLKERRRKKEQYEHKDKVRPAAPATEHEVAKSEKMVDAGATQTDSVRANVAETLPNNVSVRDVVTERARMRTTERATEEDDAGISATYYDGEGRKHVKHVKISEAAPSPAPSISFSLKELLRPTLLALGCIVPLALICYLILMRFTSQRQAATIKCRVISRRKVAILAEPAVDAEVIDYLDPEMSFWAVAQVVPADTRTYYQLADNRGWVPECSRKDMNKPVVRIVKSIPK